MNTKFRGLFVGLAVVAIIAVAYFSFIYSPPREEGLKGAIGTAERYSRMSRSVSSSRTSPPGIDSTLNFEHSVSDPPIYRCT